MALAKKLVAQIKLLKRAPSGRSSAAVLSEAEQIAALQAQLDRWNFQPYENGPNTEAEIATVEQDLGRRLPADYRWFCATHGDGRTKALTIKLANRKVVEYRRLGNAFNLRQANITYRQPDFPPGLIPCVDTMMGDVFFLRFDKSHNGSVWYWGFYEGKDPRRGLVKAADSFTHLLASSMQAPRDE